MKTATRSAQLKEIKKELSKEYGPVGQIVGLYQKGFSRKEIIELGGYNKNTTYCQIRKYCSDVTT